MGLRETKKQRVRSSIIENAIALFRDGGFEATTVREICARCELSEATFFNYFATKGGVLSAWAHREVERELARFEPDGARSLRSSMRAFCDGIAGSLEEDAEFSSRAWARVALPTETPDAAERIVRAGQESGQLRRDVSARQLGGILYVSVCGTIAEWAHRKAPRSALAPELRRTVDLVLDGSRKKNERVRARASVAQAPSVSTR